MSVHVLKPGLLTTLQDRGRPGYAALGVGTAGAMDEVALRLANALVGNAEDAAALEITLSGPRLRFAAAATIALTGAHFNATLDGRPLAAWRPQHVAAGSVFDGGPARRGTLAYLAVAGGFLSESVLGSRSSDLNAHIGPRALRTGDELTIDNASQHAAHRRSTWSLDPRPWFDPDRARPIRLIRGTHFAALDHASQDTLFAAPFRISTQSNRVGFRLDGPHLALAAPLELISEAVTAGTVQLPPGGQPIVLMAEHPTTGGYPRIAHVAAIDRPRLAQRRPGDTLTFAEIELDDAQTRYLERERELVRLIAAIRKRQA
ncbi:MAG: biotin-dependent carboxyltransferase family protein [Rhodanobacter sp.]|jgi:antagonist of KipI|nr:biotin-dependent carboxyltransferase family protein [Rhodanobacter sp.]